MGLTRMNVDTQPDQYTAETSGNRNRRSRATTPISRPWVRPVLAKNDARAPPNVRGLRLEPRRLDAAGYDAVDRRGPGVVLATSTDGQRFGGYNSKGWGLERTERACPTSSFAWRRDGGFDKLPKVGGAGMGVVDKPETNPYFGPEG